MLVKKQFAMSYSFFDGVDSQMTNNNYAANFVTVVNG